MGTTPFSFLLSHFLYNKFGSLHGCKRRVLRVRCDHFWTPMSGKAGLTTRETSPRVISFRLLCQPLSNFDPLPSSRSWCFETYSETHMSRRHSRRAPCSYFPPLQDRFGFLASSMGSSSLWHWWEMNMRCPLTLIFNHQLRNFYQWFLQFLAAKHTSNFNTWTWSLTDSVIHLYFQEESAFRYLHVTSGDRSREQCSEMRSAQRQDVCGTLDSDHYIGPGMNSIQAICSIYICHLMELWLRSDSCRRLVPSGRWDSTLRGFTKG